MTNREVTTTTGGRGGVDEGMAAEVPLVAGSEEEKDKEKNKKSDKRKRGLALVKDKERVKRIATSGGLSPHSIRGLQGASAETLKRVTLLGGKSRAKDLAGLSAAGKRGGEVVREMYGTEFYQTIGKRGGTTTLERYSIEWFSDLAKKGNAVKRGEKSKKNRKKKQS